MFILDWCGAILNRVERIRSQVLETKFEVKWEELKANYGGDSALAKPRLAFHGTTAANIESISTRGLLVPGSAAGVKHITDNGYYGKGIYLSPSYVRTHHQSQGPAFPSLSASC